MGALNTLSELVRQVIGYGDPRTGPCMRCVRPEWDARTLASFLSETRLAIQAGETPDFRTSCSHR